MEERTKTIEVSPAVKIGAGEFSILELRAPRAAEVRRAQTHYKGTLESLTQMKIHLVANVSGWPVSAVENLDIDMLEEAFSFLDKFSVPGQKTGSD